MADQPVSGGGGRIRLYQPRNEPQLLREKQQEQERSTKQPTDRSGKITKAIGVRIGTLRAYRSRVNQQPEPSPSPDSSRSETVGTSSRLPENNLSVESDTSLRTDRSTRPDTEHGVPIEHSDLSIGKSRLTREQFVQSYKDYDIKKDPDFQARSNFPDGIDPDVHPDEANLDLEKRASMAYLVKFQGTFDKDTRKAGLVQKIIDSQDLSAALRFLVYYTTVFDYDARMNRFFDAYVELVNDYDGHLDQFDGRSPAHYKSFFDYYGIRPDVFREVN